MNRNERRRNLEMKELSHAERSSLRLADADQEPRICRRHDRHTIQPAADADEPDAWKQDRSEVASKLASM
jgi:hypothetical protein